MQLPRDGVEYATITFTAYPTAATTVEASLDRATWFPFDIVPTLQADGTWAGKVLLRGPDAPAGAAGTPVPSPGATLWARVTDTPEIVPVRVGQITLT